VHYSIGRCRDCGTYGPALRAASTGTTSTSWNQSVQRRKDLATPPAGPRGAGRIGGEGRGGGVGGAAAGA
jgi:hypothetical protein